MQKQIFDVDHLSQEPADDEFIAKQEFDQTQVHIEPDILQTEPSANQETEENMARILRPQPRWWKKILAGTAVLFGVATVAQSVQWLVDTWMQHQWIYFAFALVAFSVVVLGIGAIVKEWRRLVKLKRRMILQEKSARLLRQSAVDFKQDSVEQGAEQGKTLCLAIAETMNIDPQTAEMQQWQKHFNDAYSAQEVAQLFGRTVLAPLDQQAKKLISKSAVESAVIVAVSPLALVDMFFIAWRNIRLVNRLAKIYGVELGYFSRIRLLRMVLLNMAFAGATEIVQDIGMDWLSQDLTAKLSARAAQGIGVGLLTARLGIKAMEFCRPLLFEADEKPRLSVIQKELLTTLKQTILGGEKIKQKSNVSS
ncbi:YcjF family protein [Caviibacterium pharyngocola]|uniref:UPF0283 membrane protein CVP04_05290 n=1 Tax=Caviibacterium pharyngocola TaxID=28159 RepID=A0A2M8RWE2_9PAST|nr:TIGR01620 family protein [Caviibacterium pharyngocola]PJG83191.1 TIGR01620 family protein [Caviibacterium pharyngocola]